MAKKEYAVNGPHYFTMSEVCDIRDAKSRMRITSVVQKYEELARRQWEGYCLTADNVPTGRYYAIGPSINGDDLKVLFYAPAPRKLDGYGTDSEDAIKDKDRLFNQPGYEERLKRHREMPGWDIYERDGLPLTDSIEKGAGVFIPVLIWGGEGWISTPYPEEFWEFWRTAQRSSPAVRRVNMLAGLLYLASYSPDAQSGWKQSRNYQGREFADGEGGQGMDPAQVPALVIQKAEELTRSPTCVNIQNLMNLRLSQHLRSQFQENSSSWI